jgi:hypothetical protein
MATARIHTVKKEGRMKRTAGMAALMGALMACGESREPTGPSVADLALQRGEAWAQYDAAGAADVVDDLLTRVLPTLTPEPTLTVLETELYALATALLAPDVTALRDEVDAAKQGLKEYGADAPQEEEQELEGIDFALDYVSEGLPPPSGRGKRRGTK